MALHLIKLCVGVDAVEELAAWRRERRAQGHDAIVHTRQTPKRAEEVLDGGSLYWVVKGVVRCRQAILDVRCIEDGLKTRCEILLEDAIVCTEPLPRRAFQGWRYFEPREAPRDLDLGAAPDLPSDFAAELRSIGVW